MRPERRKEQPPVTRECSYADNESERLGAFSKDRAQSYPRKDGKKNRNRKSCRELCSLK